MHSLTASIGKVSHPNLPQVQSAMTEVCSEVIGTSLLWRATKSSGVETLPPPLLDWYIYGTLKKRFAQMLPRIGFRSHAMLQVTQPCDGSGHVLSDTAPRQTADCSPSTLSRSSFCWSFIRLIWLWCSFCCSCMELDMLKVKNQNPCITNATSGR